MAATLVANVSLAAPGTSSGINTTGSTLLVAVIARTTTATTLSDSNANTWTLVASNQTNGNAFTLLYIAYNPVVGAAHTFTTSGGFPSLCVMAWSGVSAVQDLSNVKSAQANATSIQPGSVSPVYNNSLVLAGLAYRETGSVSIDAGFSISNQLAFNTGVSVGIGFAYLVQTASASVNPTWSWSGVAGICSAVTIVLASTPSGGGGGGSYAFA